MDCFGRSKEIDEIWREFRYDKNLLMLAPRRIGKTVVLNELKRSAMENDFTAILIDVEGYSDEKAFFRDCCLAIQNELSVGGKLIEQFNRRLSSLLNGSDSPSADWKDLLAQTNWKEFADQLLASLDSFEGPNKWVILIDELPVFVNALDKSSGEGSMSSFLYWLRAMRQKYRNVRWMYTGSIGLDAVARRNNIEGALNDLQPYTLKPFSAETAAEFINQVAHRRTNTIDEDASSLLIERLGWLSPYYLERVIEAACIASSEGEVLDITAINQALDHLLDLPQRTYWSSWGEHLNRNFPEPERSHLYKILECVCKSQEAVSESQILGVLNSSSSDISASNARDMLHTLCSDGYLQTTNENYEFRMTLLKEWWSKYIVA